MPRPRKKRVKRSIGRILIRTRWLIASMDERTLIVRLFGVDKRTFEWVYCQTFYDDIPGMTIKDVVKMPRLTTKRMRALIEQLYKYTDVESTKTFYEDVLAALNKRRTTYCTPSQSQIEKPQNTQ